MVESRLPMPGVRVRFPVLAFFFSPFDFFDFSPCAVLTNPNRDFAVEDGPIQHQDTPAQDLYASILFNLLFLLVF